MTMSTSLQAGHSRKWHFVQFPVTCIVIAMAFMIGTMLLLQPLAAAIRFKRTSGFDALVAVVLTITALVAAYAAYVHLIERRHATELGSKRAAPEFALGFSLGGLLFSLIMPIL